MRKLATIRQVSNILPIPNAQKIEIVQIDGWQCIAKKGEFLIGSECVYFEIDSFLPDESRYSFLGSPKSYNGKPGHRIKTMKMRGTISQGLALPLALFPEIDEFTSRQCDLADKLDIIKYDTAIITKSNGSSGGKAASTFPSFIPKTDQERIQNLTSYWTTHSDTVFEETLKLDGSSMTCYKVLSDLPIWKRILNTFGFNFSSEHFGVCSRNQELHRNDSNFWRAAIKYGIEYDLPTGYAIQGELLAPNIQSNHEKVHDIEYYVFSVYNISEQRYLHPAEKHNFINTHFSKLQTVPVVNSDIKIFQEAPDLQSLLSRVEGKSMNPKTTSEGRVYVAIDNPQIHFKCISNKYLLKEK